MEQMSRQGTPSTGAVTAPRLECRSRPFAVVPAQNSPALSFSRQVARSAEWRAQAAFSSSLISNSVTSSVNGLTLTSIRLRPATTIPLSTVVSKSVTKGVSESFQTVMYADSRVALSYRVRLALMPPIQIRPCPSSVMALTFGTKRLSRTWKRPPS